MDAAYPPWVRREEGGSRHGGGGLADDGPPSAAGGAGRGGAGDGNGQQVPEGSRAGLKAFEFCVNRRLEDDLGMRELCSLDLNKEALLSRLRNGNLGRDHAMLALRNLQLKWRKPGALAQIPELLECVRQMAPMAPTPATQVADMQGIPEIPSPIEDESVRQMSVGDLKLLLHRSGVNTDHVLMKSDLIELALRVPPLHGPGARRGPTAARQLGQSVSQCAPGKPQASECEEESVRQMSIRDLKLLLGSRGVNTDHALMKSDLVDLALKTAPQSQSEMVPPEPVWMPRGAPPTSDSPRGRFSGRKRGAATLVESDSEASPLKRAPLPSARVLRNRKVQAGVASVGAAQASHFSSRARVLDSDEESEFDSDEDARGEIKQTDAEILDSFLDECKRMSEHLATRVVKEGLKDLTEGLEVENLKDIPLKPYQQKGVRWLMQMFEAGYGAILGDEMGLGKTLQTISVLLVLQRQGVPGPHVVILPNSLLDNWLGEFRKWAPSIKVVKFHGEDRAQIRRSSKKTAFDVILAPLKLFDANGDNAARDRSFLRKIQFTSMILDEGHCIKDIASNRFRRLTALSMRWKLLLTGTIFQNRVKELISLLMFILPHSESLSLQCDVVMEHFTEIEKLDGHEKQKRLDLLQDIMQPLFLRRVKADVMQELPTKTESVELLALNEIQKKLYDSAIEHARDLREAHGWANNTLASVFSRMRRCANHALLVRSSYTDERLKKIAPVLTAKGAFGDSATVKKAEEALQTMSDHEIFTFCREYDLHDHVLPPQAFLWSNKCEYLHKKLPELQSGGHRVLIFSQWKIILDIVEEVLEMLQFSFLKMDGGTPVTERQDLVEEFNKDESIFAFLLTTRCGGQGLNLVGADTVIIHDSDFNPQVDRQAVDRAHRIGQQRPVTVIKLVSDGTVDFEVTKISQRKAELEGSIIRDAGDSEGRRKASAMQEIMAKALAE